MGGSTQHQSSSPVFQEFPNAWGETGSAAAGRSGGFGNQAAGMIGSGTPYDKALQDAILNPSYSPTSASDQAVLNSLMDVTAGRGSVRGLGAPTQSSLAQAVAPQLVQNRQNQIQDLLGGQAQALQGKGIDLQALLQLIGYGMPQIAGGTQSSGGGFGFKVI